MKSTRSFVLMFLWAFPEMRHAQLPADRQTQRKLSSGVSCFTNILKQRASEVWRQMWMVLAVLGKKTKASKTTRILGKSYTGPFFAGRRSLWDKRINWVFPGAGTNSVSGHHEPSVRAHHLFSLMWASRRQKAHWSRWVHSCPACPLAISGGAEVHGRGGHQHEKDKIV